MKNQLKRFKFVTEVQDGNTQERVLRANQFNFVVFNKYQGEAARGSIDSMAGDDDELTVDDQFDIEELNFSA